MESAMVPSVFIFTPLLYSYHIGYGKWHGTPVKPNTLPQLKVYPCLGSVYTKDFSHGGGTFPNTSKLFFGKMENFFSIRKCIRNKRRRTHLGPRLAKIFLRPFFRFTHVSPVWSPYKQYWQITSSRRTQSLTTAWNHGIIPPWRFYTKQFSKKYFPPILCILLHHINQEIEGL